MNGLLQQRRRQTMLNFGAGLIVLALLPVTGVIAWRAIRDSNAAQGVISLPSRAVPLTPTAIFAVTDEENFLTSLTVMALTPQGAGGTVMVIPVGALVGGRPVGKPRRLADVYGSDGVEALKNAVEAMTNSQIDQITVNGVDGTAELLARVGTVNATFSTDVTDTESEISDVIAEKGSVDLTPMEMSAVLAARDISGDEAGRYPSIKATWEGISAAVGSGRPGAVPAVVIPDVGAQSPADMPAFMSALFAGPINIWQIDTERIIDAERNPKDIDVYRYNAGEVVMVMASVAPSAMVAVLPTLTVQVDSPFDDSTVTQDSVFRILYMGTNVVLVRVVASVPPPVTIIKYSDEMDRAIAEPLTTMLGDVVFEKATERVDGVDIQIVLGDSFVTFMSDGAKPDPNIAPQDLVAPTTDAPPTETTP
ncbi:MAG: hypothetical protein JHD36_09475 [Ilumatobacteraceae bacterium]|nr:hypothetical protein [Ilumatobacteraceae bacterium]